MPRLRRPTTLYERIAAYYRRLIVSRVLRPGDQLPPVRVIAAEFGVWAGTAQRAVTVLRDEGLIRRKGRRLEVRSKPDSE